METSPNLKNAPMGARPRPVTRAITLCNESTNKALGDEIGQITLCASVFEVSVCGTGGYLLRE